MNISCEDIVLINEKLYCFASNANILFCINMQTDDTEYMTSIPGKGFWEKRLVSRIVSFENNLYLLPLKTGNIWKYSLDSNEMHEVPIRPYSNNWADLYFRNAIVFQNKLYIFGGYYPAVIIFNLDDGTVNYDEKPFAERRSGIFKDIYFRGCPVQIGENVYLASGVDNSIFVYNLTTSAYEWKKVGSAENRYSGIIRIPDGFLLSPRMSNMSIVKTTEGETVEYKIQTSKAESIVYIGIIKWNEGYLIPTNNIKGASVFIDENWRVHEIDEVYTVCKDQDGTKIRQSVDGTIEIVRAKDKKTYSYNINETVSTEFVKEIKNHVNAYDNKVMYENDQLSLKEWISIL